MAGRIRAIGQWAYERPSLLCWALLAAGVAALTWRLTGGLDPYILAPIIGAAVVATFLLARGWGELGVLVAYLVAMLFFIFLRDVADETGRMPLSTYVIDWELWMFGGDTPTAWLQARIGGTGRDPGFAAVASAILHWTWFVFPHAAVVGTWLLARRMTWRVALIVTATFYLGALLYFMVPTEPPWLAAERGLLDGVVRAMHGVGPALLGQGFYDWAFEAAAQPNPTAAMPSLHFAASFVVVGVGIVLRSRFTVAVGLLYSLSLAFALIYLGEHYAADIIAGAGVAAIAFGGVESARWLTVRARPAWERWSARAQPAWERWSGQARQRWERFKRETRRRPPRGTELG